MHGGFDPRRSAPLVRVWMRLAYRCGRPLARLSIRTNTLTTLTLFLCLGAPLALLPGPVWAVAAAGLVCLAAFVETLDATVAVLTGRITPLGSVYHAVAARLGEACWLAALWLAGAPGWLAAAACAVAWLHEYVRTESALSGMSPAWMVTMAERPMRLWVSVAGLTASGLATLLSSELAVGTATMAAIIWLLLGIGGLVQLADSLQQALR